MWSSVSSARLEIGQSRLEVAVTTPDAHASGLFLSAASRKPHRLRLGIRHSRVHMGVNFCYHKTMDAELVKKLREYFAKRDDVVLAYLFGSFSRGEEYALSDMDIALYFKSKSGKPEYENKDVWMWDEEGQISSDLQILTKRNIDLVVINRSSATIVFEALRGIELKNSDPFTQDELMSRSMFDAIDFRYTAQQYYETFERSHSLNALDRTKLNKVAQLFKDEIDYLKELKTMTQSEYTNDRAKKRALERAVENSANMLIDMIRILIASNHKPVPSTYEEIIRNAIVVEGFDEGHAEKLSKAAGMRNLLAHQYDDLRFSGIKAFIERTESSFDYLLEFVKEYLKKN